MKAVVVLIVLSIMLSCCKKGKEAIHEKEKRKFYRIVLVSKDSIRHNSIIVTNGK